MSDLLGQAQHFSAEKWNIVAWSKRPHVHWVDIEWPHYGELVAWLEEKGLPPPYPAGLTHYDEFLVESETLRVELRLRFAHG